MGTVPIPIADLSAGQMAAIEGGGGVSDLIGKLVDVALYAFHAGYEWGYNVLGPAIFG